MASPSEFSFLPPTLNRTAKNFNGNAPPPDFIARYTRRRISSRKFARHLHRHFPRSSLVRVACLRRRNSSYSLPFCYGRVDRETVERELPRLAPPRRVKERSIFLNKPSVQFFTNYFHFRDFCLFDAIAVSNELNFTSNEKLPMDRERYLDIISLKTLEQLPRKAET